MSTMHNLSVNYTQFEPEPEPEPLSTGLPTPIANTKTQHTTPVGFPTPISESHDDYTYEYADDFPSPSPKSSAIPPHISTNTTIIHNDANDLNNSDDDDYLYCIVADTPTTSSTVPLPPPPPRINSTTSTTTSSTTPNPYDNINIIQSIPSQTNTISIKLNNKPTKYKPKKTLKTMTLTEFLNVSVENDIFANGYNNLDNFDIAKEICNYFDVRLNNTNTVCLVADIGKQPQISYWCKEKWYRKHKNILNNKYILIYRACKHIKAKQPIISRTNFEKFVKQISIQYENSSCSKICDILDDKFGSGCHYARSVNKKPAYDIYCRFSDKYECGFKLPTGKYIIAWRR